MTTRIEAEAQIIAAVLQGAGRCSRAELERTLTNIGAPLARLVERGIVREVGNAVEVPNAQRRHEYADQLAAVVIHVLVTEGGEQGMAAEQVARECERDAEHEADREEVQLALRLLELYELAVRVKGRWVATLPARKAADLSF
jgi:hypothetical protein